MIDPTQIKNENKSVIKHNDGCLETPFLIRAYAKTELAMLYSPNQCVTVALRILYRWMRANPRLMGELHDVGYHKFRHSFTPLEVEILVKYLGRP